MILKNVSSPVWDEIGRKFKVAEKCDIKKSCTVGEIRLSVNEAVPLRDIVDTVGNFICIFIIIFYLCIGSSTKFSRVR